MWKESFTTPRKTIRRDQLREMVPLADSTIWARELITLGHEARMMPPAYVKPYIRRQKNDAADAAAICEAVTRPSMRFVGVRSRENQAALMRDVGLATYAASQWAAWPPDRGRRDRPARAAICPRTGRADRGLQRNNPV
jgi:hypothetical protein